VLHVINSFHRGGTEGQAVQLVRLLREHAGHEIMLACLDDRGPLQKDLGSEVPETLVYPLTSLHDRNTASQLWRMASTLHARKVDVVHTHDVYSNIFGIPAARLAGVPVRIASRRDTGGVGTSGRRRVEVTMYRLVQRIVANSEAVRRDLITQGVPAHKIVTIRNGVEIGRLAPVLARSEALRVFRLPPERRFVTLVANLRHAVKDHPTFLRAARRIRAAVPDTAFVIAGEGELAPLMQDLAEHLGLGSDVFFLGPCDAIGELLAISDVCALSSRAEGLSNAVLEYMAAARPVVATDVGGVSEVVVEGETGFLVRPGDDQAMAERIIALLQHPERAKEMGGHGRLRVEREFSSRLQLASTLELYNALLDQTRR
jgi:L-malate glycosyltransferase